MSSPVAWALYGSTGAPLTGATPAFVDYCTRAGVARTPPTILELGGGLYGFAPTDADESTGVCYLIDNGAAASPRRVSGAVTTAALPFTAWHLEDGAGALWAGAAPTVATYRSLAGALASPGVVAATAYLVSVTPTGADAAVGVTFRADSAAGAWPANVTDVLVAAAGGSVIYSPVVHPSQPSTYQAALQRSGAAVTWKDYQTDIAPPWLQAGSGWAWLRALGDMKDELELRVKDATKARFPLLAPVDALAVLADERGLPQGGYESVAEWSARLQAAWASWATAGTLEAVVAELARTGIGSRFAIITPTRWWLYDMVGVTVTVVSSSLGMWNSAVLVHEAISLSPDKLLKLASIWRQWAPAHERLESISYGSSRIWGPSGLLGGTTWSWGAGTWTTTEVTWLNPSP
jgi:hypothetical protein